VQLLSAGIQRSVGASRVSPINVLVTRGVPLERLPGLNFDRHALILRAGKNRRTVDLSRNAPPDIEAGMVMEAGWRRQSETDIALTMRRNYVGSHTMVRIKLHESVALQVANQRPWPKGLDGARVLASAVSDDYRAFDLLMILTTLQLPWSVELLDQATPQLWRVCLRQYREQFGPPRIQADVRSIET
jgi:hypothetical protein